MYLGPGGSNSLRARLSRSYSLQGSPFILQRAIRLGTNSQPIRRIPETVARLRLVTVLLNTCVTAEVPKVQVHVLEGPPFLTGPMILHINA